MADDIPSSVNHQKGKLPRLFVVLWIVFVASAVPQQPVVAAVISFSQPLSPIDPETYRQILPLIDRNHEIIGSIETVFAERFDPPNRVYSFLVVRAENDECMNDKCITFLISEEAGVRKLILAAFLPRRLYVGDSTRIICTTCGEIYTFGFVDESGTGYEVAATKDYVVLYNGVLKGF